ncbi:hypothetical protein KEM55_008988, partial [Ascosphaera atra]
LSVLKHLLTMSSLTYSFDKGAGEKALRNFHYSQAVIIPGTKIVKCAGQGGWDPEGNLDDSDLKGQVERAFNQVERVLQTVGLSGWEDVYSLRSYHLDIDASLPLVVEQMKSRMPNHSPIWTCIGVTKLADPKMLIELEVEAYDSRQ